MNVPSKFNRKIRGVIMNRFKNFNLTVLPILIGAATFASTANAQVALEEIVVTAQKRSQSLQDVGITAAAFSGARLKEAVVTDVVDVASLTPNVQVNYGLGNNFFNIRGLGLNEFVANLDSPVAVHVDEVYQSKGFLTGMSLFDIERVEVLKGPQGDLFGRNTTGGAINFITTKPGKELGGNVNLGFGDFDTTTFEGALNIPLSDNVSARIAGYVTDQSEGFYRNTTGTEQFTDDSGVTRTRVLNDPSRFNADEGFVDEKGVRASLLWESDKTEVLASLHYGKDDSQLHPYEGVGIKDNSNGLGGSFVAPSSLCPQYLTGTVNGTTPNCSRGLDVDAIVATASTISVGGVDRAVVFNQNGSFSFVEDVLTAPNENDPFVTQGDLSFDVDNESFGGALRIDHEFDNFTLTSITGYEDFDQNQREDSDGSLLQSVEVYWFTEFEQFTQEIRIASNFDHDRWNYIAGAFYENDTLVNGDYLTAYETTFGSAFNNYSSYTQDVEAFALFGHAEWQLNDKFRLIGGARFNTEETTLEGGTFAGLGITGIGGEERPEFGVDGVTPFSRNDQANVRSSAAALPNGGVRKDDDFSAKVGLNYTPNDDLLVYGSISTGFRSGGFSIAFANTQDELAGDGGSLSPETVTAYELGFKSSLSDRFRLNGALFYYDLQDAHIDLDAPGGVVPVTVNGDSVDVVGAELEVQWAISESVIFEGGLGYIDSEISDDTPVVSPGVLAIIPNLQSGTLQGNRTSFAPELSFTGQLRYQTSLTNKLGLTVSTDFSWRDEAFLEANNQPTNLRDAYWLVNGRVAIANLDAGWEASLWVKNLTDEEYQVYLNDLPAFGWLLNGYAAPRTIGINVGYEF
jgi:iron complex outermembrane receptor protein